MKKLNDRLGQVVILNGVPRAGKTSIAEEIQKTAPGVWMNLGVDNHIQATPAALRPGVGLRPGKHIPLRVEEMVPVLYAALYDSVRAHALHGLNVVMDSKHHDSYLMPRGYILPDCARRLAGLPVLFVGVKCSLEEIWKRREQTWGHSATTAKPETVESVELGQSVTHQHDYDLVVDTTERSPNDCAAEIMDMALYPPSPTAFERLAAAAGE